MSVRRTRVAPSRSHGLALSAVLLLLAPLAACTTDDTAAVTPAVGQASPTATPAAPDASDPAAEPGGDPSPGGSESPSDQEDAEAGPDADADPGAAGPGAGGRAASAEPGRKVLEGGGFARAVPGSDAPDRKVDVGPQYAVSADLDIREIERLVEAVEAIAKSQRVEQPLATGGSVAAAVGTFSYRWFRDGTVAPDPDWVAANIRYGRVPILGTVRCHKAMLPQLRGALREVVARGLADEIHPDEYGGCYYPRFIGRDPGKGLSLHTWGIALDLNVPGNMRGVRGEIDRDVVAIFKKWGFAWGGDWRWTDPMHFELAELVSTR